MKVKIISKAQKSFLKLSVNIQQRIAKAIDDLADNSLPSGVKKLTNQPGFRIRVGDYRILYIIDTKAKTLTIISIAHRFVVYKKMKF